MNCQFYAKLDLEERLFVLAHETWHCVLLHFARLQNRNPDEFNYATDLEIHFILQKEKMKEPFVLPHDPKWEGLSAEEIYEKIHKKNHPNYDKRSKNVQTDKQKREQAQHKKPDGCCNSTSRDKDKEKDNGGESEQVRISRQQPDPGCCSKGFGSNEQSFDEHVYTGSAEQDSEHDPDFAPCVDAQSVENMRQIVIQTACSIERRQGRLPGNLKDIVDRLRKPELNWKELLKQFVTSCFGGSRRWLPPARRYVGMGLYLQSRRDEKFNAVMAIDTSGSTTGDLPQFFAELSNLLKSFGNYELTVIQCDCNIQHIEKFSGDNPLPGNYQWTSYGHGGTSFIPPFEYVKEHKLRPDIFIYLTDGFGGAPEKAPQFPVLWVLTADADNPANWGKKIKLKGLENHG